MRVFIASHNIHLICRPCVTDKTSYDITDVRVNMTEIIINICFCFVRGVSRMFNICRTGCFIEKIDGLFDCCITSCKQYFNYNDHESKVTNNTLIPLGGW